MEEEEDDDNYDDGDDGVDVHFVTTVLLSITTYIYHLFHHHHHHHQPGHLRRSTLHARQGERGSVGGKHHPVAAQSQVRLLVRYYPQCERLRVMVLTTLLNTTIL